MENETGKNNWLVRDSLIKQKVCKCQQRERSVQAVADRRLWNLFHHQPTLTPSVKLQTLISWLGLCFLIGESADCVWDFRATARGDLTLGPMSSTYSRTSRVLLLSFPISTLLPQMCNTIVWQINLGNYSNSNPDNRKSPFGRDRASSWVCSSFQFLTQEPKHHHYTAHNARISNVYPF